MDILFTKDAFDGHQLVYMKHQYNPAGKASRGYLFRVRQNSLCRCNFLYTCKFQMIPATVSR